MVSLFNLKRLVEKIITIDVKQFLHHLQRHHSLFFIQLRPNLRRRCHCSGSRLIASHHSPGRRICIAMDNMVLVVAISKLDSHDPVWSRLLPGTLVPHADVRVLSVEPQASHRRGRGTAAPFLELGLQHLGQALGRIILGWDNVGVSIGSLGRGKVGFGVSTTHQDRGLIVRSRRFLRGLERSQPYPPLPAEGPQRKSLLTIELNYELIIVITSKRIMYLNGRRRIIRITVMGVEFQKPKSPNGAVWHLWTSLIWPLSERRSTQNNTHMDYNIREDFEVKKGLDLIG